jgi:hypothetical protein
MSTEFSLRCSVWQRQACKIEGMNSALHSFAAWLASRSHLLEFPLRISPSRYAPGGVRADCTGLEQVLARYCWNGENWQQTKQGIDRLRRDLAAAIRIRDANIREQECLRACLNIVRWGGERNRKVGASLFLTGKRAAHSLVECLITAGNALAVRLPVNAARRFRPVEKMNSMLAKVHAFHSEDGLPIYDSRVAFAAAALVEIYRKELSLSWDSVPEEVAFPAIDRARRITSYDDVCDPGFLYRNAASCTAEWCSAMVRLGSVFRQVLTSAPKLFRAEDSLQKRMHALEASFFMLGCNPNTFRQYLGRAEAHCPPRVPFALNLLSRKGSLGCSLRCVHEASDYLPHFHLIRAEREKAAIGADRRSARSERLEGEWDRRNHSRETLRSKSGNWP